MLKLQENLPDERTRVAIVLVLRLLVSLKPHTQATNVGVSACVKDHNKTGRTGVNSGIG